MATICLALILPALIFLTWSILSAQQIIPEYLLPSPQKIGLALYDYALGSGRGFKGRLGADLQASLTRVSMGFGLASLAGLTLGLLSGRYLVAAKILAPIINALRGVPGICWLPLALIWFGIGQRTTLFLIALAAFCPIYINTYISITRVPPLFIRAGLMLGFNQAQLLIKIIIPAAMPQILAGLRLGLGLSFAYLVLGELTGVPHGLGAMIMDARTMGRVDMIISGILILALVGWFSDLGLQVIAQLTCKSIRRQ